jgi:hypothetical protein
MCVCASVHACVRSFTCLRACVLSSWVWDLGVAGVQGGRDLHDRVPCEHAADGEHLLSGEACRCHGSGAEGTSSVGE